MPKRLIVSEAVKVELNGSEYLLEPGDNIVLEALPGLEPHVGLYGDNKPPRKDQGEDSIEAGVHLGEPIVPKDPQEFTKFARKLSRAKRMKEFFPVVNFIDKNEFDELVDIISNDEIGLGKYGLTSSKVIEFLQYVRDADHSEIYKATAESLDLKATFQLYNELYQTRKVPTVSMIQEEGVVDFNNFKDFLKHKNVREESFLLKYGNDYVRARKGNIRGDPIQYTFNRAIRHIYRHMRDTIKNTDIAYRQFLLNAATDIGINSAGISKVVTYLRDLVGKLSNEKWRSRFARGKDYLDRSVLGESWMPSGKIETSMIGDEPVQTELVYDEENMPSPEEEGIRETPLSRTTEEDEEQFIRRMTAEDEGEIPFEREMAQKRQMELERKIEQYIENKGERPSEEEIEELWGQVEDEVGVDTDSVNPENIADDSSDVVKGVEFDDKELDTDPILNREFQDLVARAIA